MKILITTDAFTPVVNGVVTSTLNLYKQLKQHGHDVRILTLAHARHSRKEEDVYYISSFGINIYPDARVTVKFRDHYINEIIEWKPDVIHSQTEFCTFLFARRIARNISNYYFINVSYIFYVIVFLLVGQCFKNLNAQNLFANF